MRKAVFIDLPNFYSRLLKSGLGEPRELRDYFLHWLDLDLLSKWLTEEFCPTWVFYSGRRFDPSSERIEGQHLAEYIKRISRLQSVTPYDVNIPGDQREPITAKCECGKTISGQWESEKGVDASLITHLFDTADSWDEAMLLSGDADFTPAVRALRRRGKIVSGAGFPSASECLIQELYGFKDLSNEILRDDFAAYSLFGKNRLVSRWLTEKISPQDVLSNVKSVNLDCKWMIGKGDPSSVMYAQGKCLLVHDYTSIVFDSNGLAKESQRITILNDFKQRFPELAFDTTVLLINPFVWERVTRALPEVLRSFSGAAVGSAGSVGVVWARQDDGEFVRKSEA